MRRYYLLPIITLFFSVGCEAPQPKPDEPTFAKSEKDAMTLDEKLAIYNANKTEQHKVICVGEKITGSRLRRTVCTTQAERDANRRAQQDELRRRQAGMNCGGNGCARGTTN